MTHSITLPGELVTEMKTGKGINPIIDQLRNTLMIDDNFDGTHTLKLTSDNKDIIEIAEEWLKSQYSKMSRKEPDPGYQVEIKDSKVIWKLSVKTAELLYGLYKKDLESIPNVECNERQGSTFLSCNCSNISEARSRINELIDKSQKVKQCSIDVRKKTKIAKKFCQDNSTDTCICSYNETTKHIDLVGKDTQSIALIKEEWKSVSENGSSKKHKKSEIATAPEDDIVKQETKTEPKPTKTETSTEKEQASADDVAVASKPRVQEIEPRYQRDRCGDNQVGMQASSQDSVKGASVRTKTVASGETPKCSINREPDQQQRRPNEQQSRNTKSGDILNVVGPKRQEQDKYVFEVGSMKVLVYNQSVVNIQNMDAIVNAANDQLAHAGGIAYFISKAAGRKMDEECDSYVRKNRQLKVAEVFVSNPGNMTCKGIFHAVGPRWSEYIGHEDKCAEDLCKTIYKCLECMEERRWKRIALCAISSGIFGVPKRLCAAMYIRAIEDFAVQHPGSDIEVHFIDVNQEIIDLMVTAHEDRLKHGHSPDFKAALKFPSAKKGFSFSKKHYGGMRQDRDGDASTGSKRYDGGGAGSYKHNQKQFSHNEWNEWIEYKPEKVQNVGIDIEKFCKMSSGISKATLEDTSEGKCVYCPDKVAAKKLSCGHRFCKPCSIQSKTECQKCKVEKKEDTDVKKSNCPICLEDHTSLASLPCSHEFCKYCLKKAADEKPVCPVCAVPFGIITGTQPDGRMFFRTARSNLPGYASVGTIEIQYEFKDGIQQKCHPSPGKQYKGITRTAYLPDNDEGRKVLRLLKKAFSRRLVFTIGDSRTTGQTGQITWNDIHHKTSQYEGKFCYPDKTYLSRVQEELAAKGITE